MAKKLGFLRLHSVFRGFQSSGGGRYNTTRKSDGVMSKLVLRDKGAMCTKAEVMNNAFGGKTLSSNPYIITDNNAHTKLTIISSKGGYSWHKALIWTPGLYSLL
jgi:hypothetical protein